MSTDVVRERGFSLVGFLYYKEHQKDFTPKAIFSLLQTREGWKKSSKTKLMSNILRGDYAITRGDVIYIAIPQQELKGGDIVTLNILRENLEWKYNGEKLIRVK